MLYLLLLKLLAIHSIWFSESIDWFLSSSLIFKKQMIYSTFAATEILLSWLNLIFRGNRKRFFNRHISSNWITEHNFTKSVLVHLLKRQKTEEKLKRRAKLAGNLISELYPQPFTPPSPLTGIQTTFVASLSLSLSTFNLDKCSFFLCLWSER